MSQPDVSTASRRTAVRIEDSIRRDRLETGALIGPDGTIVVRRQGLPDQVGFTVAELGSTKDATFTHNHPAGQGPSLDDALLAAQYSMREMRVVTAAYRYGIRRLTSGMMLPLQAAFPIEQLGAMASAHDDVRKGLLTPPDFAREVLHRTWSRLANRFAIDDWRESS